MEREVYHSVGACSPTSSSSPQCPSPQWGAYFNGAEMASTTRYRQPWDSRFAGAVSTACYPAVQMQYTYTAPAPYRTTPNACNSPKAFSECSPSEYSTTHPPCYPGVPIQTERNGKMVSCGPDGCNLFIFHLPNEMTNMDLYRLFLPYGKIVSTRIVVAKDTGRSRGFGFVSYEDVESADAAVKALNGHKVGYKRLKVEHKRGEHHSSDGEQHEQKAKSEASEKETDEDGSSQTSEVPQVSEGDGSVHDANTPAMVTDAPATKSPEPRACNPPAAVTPAVLSPTAGARPMANVQGWGAAPRAWPSPRTQPWPIQVPPATQQQQQQQYSTSPCSPTYAPSTGGYYLYQYYQQPNVAWGSPTQPQYANMMDVSYQHQPCYVSPATQFAYGPRAFYPGPMYRSSVPYTAATPTPLAWQH